MVRIAIAILAAFFVFTGAIAAQDEGTYLIKNLNSDKLLAVDEAGTKIVQDDATKDKPCVWKLVKTEGEWFKVVDVKTGKVLTAPKFSTDAGASQALLEKDNGTKNQEWSFDKFSLKGTQYLLIKSKSDKMILDVQDRSKDAGAHVIHWPLNNKGDRKNQLWVLEPTK
jgi:hypothetical protein